MDFNRRDCKIAWNPITAQGANVHFKDYHFQIYSSAYNATMAAPGTGSSYETYLDNPYFDFPFDHNKALFGTPQAKFFVQVKGRSIYDSFSPTWAFATAVNYTPPAAPSNFEAYGGFRWVQFSWYPCTALDFSHYDIQTHEGTAAFGGWESYDQNALARGLTADADAGESISLQVKAVDLYGFESSMVSGRADTVGVKVADGQAFQIVPTDSTGSSFDTLKALYDGNLDTAYVGLTGGVSGASWIQYQYPVEYVFNGATIWTDQDFGLYLGYRDEDAEDWVYFAGNAEHGLSGSALIEYGTEVAARYNYYKTEKEVDGKVLMPFPTQRQFEKIKLIRQNENLIDRRNCESTTPPMIFDETVPVLTSATFARDIAEAHAGTYSYKVTKTVASGTAAYVTLCDNELTSDMHGLVAGHTYTFFVWIKVPVASGIALDEIRMRIEDYIAPTWAGTDSSYPTAFDTWQKLTVTRTIRSGATGTSILFEIISTAENNEYFYVDDVTLEDLSEDEVRIYEWKNNVFVLADEIVAGRMWLREGLVIASTPTGQNGVVFTEDGISLYNEGLKTIGLSGDGSAFFGASAGRQFKIEADGKIGGDIISKNWATTGATAGSHFDLDAGVVRLRDTIAGVTAEFGGDVVDGSKTITGVEETELSRIVVGDGLYGSGITAGALVDTLYDTSLLMSLSANASGAGFDLEAVGDRTRRIITGPGFGLKAFDAKDNIIHDIPNVIIASDMVYGGHIVFKDAPSYISAIFLSYDDAEEDRTVTSSTTNRDISSYLPKGLTNVKGVLLSVVVINYIHQWKTQFGTYMRSYVRYSTRYGETPGLYNYLTYSTLYHTAADADNIRLTLATGRQCVCPVTFSGGVPYITYNLYATFGGMTVNNIDYYCEAYVFLVGFLI